MNISKRLKRKLKYIPRYNPNNDFVPRKDHLYYNQYCCRGCYFGWGRLFEKKHLYKHESAESNYDGIRKEYWVDYDVILRGESN